MATQPDTRLWTYIRAFVHDLKTSLGVVGIVLITPARIYWPNAPMRICYPIAVVGCIFSSSYMVWRNERVSAQQGRSGLEQENAQLKLQLQQLRDKPYDKKHRELSEKKLRDLNAMEMELLAFLLHRGETEHSILENSCLDHGAGFVQALNHLQSLGLIQRQEKPKIGRAGTELFWQITPDFKNDLKELVPLSNEHYFPI